MGRRGLTLLVAVLLPVLGPVLGPGAAPAQAASRGPSTDPRLTPTRVVVPAKISSGAPSSGDPSSGLKRVGLARLGGGPVSSGAPATAPRVGADVQALTTFTKTFTSAGRRYPYRMVGTDPQRGAATTTLASTLVPLTVRVHTGDGSVDGSGDGSVDAVGVSPAVRARVLGSGLFGARAFPGGVGQYGDVFLRTQFWSWLNGGRTAWHVVLAAPALAPALVLDVPAAYGGRQIVRGVRTAFVDVDWLDQQLQATVTAAAPDVLTQVLAGNVVLCKPYTPDLTSCGIAGYHSATTDAAGTHTYTWQAYLHSAVFGASTGFSDIGPMSHELAEWLTDPYLDNVVPAWRSPVAPQYGCLDALESGDPVAGRFLTLDGLTYQDEAYVWWFARSPSLAWKGRYTWFDTFRTVSPGC